MNITIRTFDGKSFLLAVKEEELDFKKVSELEFREADTVVAMRARKRFVRRKAQTQSSKKQKTSSSSSSSSSTSSNSQQRPQDERKESREEQIQNLVNVMGFSEDIVRRALHETNGNPNQAVELILGGGLKNDQQIEFTNDQMEDETDDETDNETDMEDEPEPPQQIAVVMLVGNQGFLTALQTQIQQYARTNRNPNQQQPQQYARTNRDPNQQQPQPQPQHTMDTTHDDRPPQETAIAGERNIANLIRMYNSPLLAPRHYPGPSTPRSRFSRDDIAAIQRLMTLGYSRSQALEVFLAFDKNESFAAHYLLNRC